MTRERVPVETSFRSHSGTRAAGGTGKRTGDAVRLCALARRRAAIRTWGLAEVQPGAQQVIELAGDAAPGNGADVF
ncbi:MAG TPA: hypothetical protein ENN32_06200 [Chloroflexi bacterium]|nr:hypothetical protein [Chloroflexota bacterium]